MASQQDTIVCDVESNPVGQPGRDQILLASSKPKWFAKILTGSELDVLILAVFFPAILISWCFSRRPQHDFGFKHFRGNVYCKKTQDKLVFLAESVNDESKRTLAKRPLVDLIDIKFSYSHETSVTFLFRSNERIKLYFSGVWSDLASFRSSCVSDLKEHDDAYLQLGSGH